MNRARRWAGYLGELSNLGFEHLDSYPYFGVHLTFQCNHKTSSDLRVSWKLHDPQGTATHLLALRPRAGHGKSEQRAGPVEDMAGLGMKPTVV